MSVEKGNKLAIRGMWQGRFRLNYDHPVGRYCSSQLCCWGPVGRKEQLPKPAIRVSPFSKRKKDV